MKNFFVIAAVFGFVTLILPHAVFANISDDLGDALSRAVNELDDAFDAVAQGSDPAANPRVRAAANELAKLANQALREGASPKELDDRISTRAIELMQGEEGNAVRTAINKVSCNADIHVARGNYDEVARIMKSRGLMNADGTLTETGRSYTGKIFMHKVNPAGSLVGAGEEALLEGTARAAKVEAEAAARGIKGAAKTVITNREVLAALERSAKTSTCSADDAMIAKIVKMLNSEKYSDVLGSESVGGNAGPGRAAVNAYVNRVTGEIVAIGNVQHLPTAVTQNPANARVTFVNDIGRAVFKDGGFTIEGGGRISGVFSSDLAHPETLERLRAEMRPEEFAQFLKKQEELKKTLELLKRAIDIRNSSKGATAVTPCAPKAPCPIKPQRTPPSQPYPIGPKVSESIVRNVLSRIGQFLSIGTKEGFIRSVLNSVGRGIRGGLWGAINPLNIAAIMATQYPEVMNRIDYSQNAIDETEKQLVAQSRKLLSLSVQLSDYYDRRNDLSAPDLRSVRNLKGFYDETLVEALANATWLDIKSKELHEYTDTILGQLIHGLKIDFVLQKLDEVFGGEFGIGEFTPLGSPVQLRATRLAEAFGEKWNFKWDFDDLSHCRKTEELPCVQPSSPCGDISAYFCPAYDYGNLYLMTPESSGYGTSYTSGRRIPFNNDPENDFRCFISCQLDSERVGQLCVAIDSRPPGGPPTIECRSREDSTTPRTTAPQDVRATGGSAGAPPTPPPQKPDTISSQTITAAVAAKGKVAPISGTTLTLSCSKTSCVVRDTKKKNKVIGRFAPRAGVSVKLPATAAPKTPSPTSKPPTTGGTANFDFGDGPATTPNIFPTLLRQNGIRHAPGDIVVLGNTKTVESDALTRSNTPQDNMDQDDAPPTETANGGVQVLVRAQKAKQKVFLNVAVDANANGRIEPTEWRVRNQQAVIALAGVPQPVLLRGLRYSALLGKWVRVTVTTAGIKNYNGTKAQKNGETEDWFIAAVPSADCPPTPIPQCAPGTELMTGRGQNNCPVYECHPTSAPPGAPAPAGSKGAVGPSSAIQSNWFLGLLLKALGR